MRNHHLNFRSYLILSIEKFSLLTPHIEMGENMQRDSFLSLMSHYLLNNVIKLYAAMTNFTPNFFV